MGSTPLDTATFGDLKYNFSYLNESCYLCAKFLDFE